LQRPFELQRISSKVTNIIFTKNSSPKRISLIDILHISLSFTNNRYICFESIERISVFYSLCFVEQDYEGFFFFFLFLGMYGKNGYEMGERNCIKMIKELHMIDQIRSITNLSVYLMN
jgi:hypothetical protein